MIELTAFTQLTSHKLGYVRDSRAYTGHLNRYIRDSRPFTGPLNRHTVCTVITTVNSQSRSPKQSCLLATIHSQMDIAQTSWGWMKVWPPTSRARQSWMRVVWYTLAVLSRVLCLSSQNTLTSFRMRNRCFFECLTNESATTTVFVMSTVYILLNGSRALQCMR